MKSTYVKCLTIKCREVNYLYCGIKILLVHVMSAPWEIGF